MNEEMWKGASREESSKTNRNQVNYQENNSQKKRPRIQRSSSSMSGSENYSRDRQYGTSYQDRSSRGGSSYGKDRNGSYGKDYRQGRSYGQGQEGGRRFSGASRGNSRPNGYASREGYATLNEGLNFRESGGGRGYSQRGDVRQGRSYGEGRSFNRKNGNYNPSRRQGQEFSGEYKPREVDLNKPVRLNKFLANAGICSRREADEYIQAGVITVNGEVVTELGSKILPTDKVMFHDQTIRSERKVYLLLNKPKNCVTTTEDTHDRMTVLDLVKTACAERIYPVGRLDRNTTGVLLLTNDGDLASKLTHPKYEKKKIYHATLDKPLDIEAYQTIMGGLDLDGEMIRPDSLEFTAENDRTQIGIEIHSGQNRVVRRIFEKVGYKVIKLDRVFFAGLTKKNLPRGKYRFLTPREVNMLLMGAFE